MSNLDHIFTVIIEGNIGSGKSTLLNKFSSYKGIDILPEPVDKWRSLNGQNLLQLMYQDPAKHSMMFQSYVQLTMMQNHIQKPSSSNTDLKILERSLFSAKYCFIKHAREHGNLSDAEYEVITDWFDYLTRRSQLDLQVDLVVYVRTSPEVAWNRVKSRGRSEEDTVPLKYLQEIHQLHEDWLFTPNPDFNVEVMIIDGDQDLIDGTHRHQDIVRRVLERVWGKQVEEKRRERRVNSERRQLELAFESVHLDENENEEKDEI